MRRTRLLSLGSALALAAPLSAQNCTDNQYRAYIVDQNGTPPATEPGPVGPQFIFAGETVYLAFDPNTPSGLYYVHVTDLIGGADEVRSTNDPNDRFVNVVNQGGVITLSLPLSSNPHPAFGHGLNGVGQSVPLGAFHATTELPCTFKAWYGDCWDLSLGPTWPYLIQGGYNAALGRCCVRSYSSFRIGNGIGTTVSGSVFLDTDHDGIRAVGEPGVAGATVTLNTGTTSVATTTDGSGVYRFTGVTANQYTVEFQPGSGATLTTPVGYSIDVCGCGLMNGGDFGFFQLATRHDGHTVGFWGNKNGLRLVTTFNLLPTLAALCLVDGSGNYVAPGSIGALDTYLQNATARNMANMLSAQFVAMTCNVAVGFVDPGSRVQNSVLGTITIQELLQRAAASLCAHPYTPVGSPWRAEQEALKNALDDANNNRNWVL
jgi:hypothetical protein